MLANSCLPPMEDESTIHYLMHSAGALAGFAAIAIILPLPGPRGTMTIFLP
jgi:hypothetical protein